MKLLALMLLLKHVLSDPALVRLLVFFINMTTWQDIFKPLSRPNGSVQNTNS